MQPIINHTEEELKQIRKVQELIHSGKLQPYLKEIQTQENIKAQERLKELDK